MELTAPIPNPDSDTMGKLLDHYLDTKKCRHGDIVNGVIVSVTSKSILIDIGGKCDAIVQPHEVERMADQKPQCTKAWTGGERLCSGHRAGRWHCDRIPGACSTGE